MKRSYRQSKRAIAAEETRQKIVAATAELHRTMGPRATTVAEVARRAGVDRLTVYNHFPDEGALVAGCQGHWLALHPPPDPTGLAGIADPEARLAAALASLWAWYGETREMTANVLRDGPTMPAFAPVLSDMRAGLEAVTGLLMVGRREGVGLRATLLVALSFPTWEALTGDGQLPPEKAAALVGAWVCAAEAQ